MPPPPRSPHKRTKSTTNDNIYSYTTPLHTRTTSSHDYFHPHSSPSQHISPTKAAAQSRLNHEITQITSWLDSLFAPQQIPVHLLKWRDEVLSSASGPVALGLGLDARLGNADAPITPSWDGSGGASAAGFGRNEVLEALKGLKQLNLSADHLKMLVREAELEELAWLEKVMARTRWQREDGVVARGVLDEVYDALDANGRDSLEALARSGTMLGIDLVGVSSEQDKRLGHDLKTLFTRKILDQANRRLVLNEQVRELQLQNRVIASREMALGDKKESAHDEQDTEQVHTQTAEFNRDTKQVNLKIMEYDDRVKGLQRQLASLRTESLDLQDILDSRRRVEQRKTAIALLRGRLASFHGLPPDLEASRGEVRRAMGELEALKRKRDGLFERVGSGRDNAE